MIWSSMGIGDEIMASGMARGAYARGKRIAFGDGITIHWSHFSEMVFRNNPNVAPPGNELDSNLEWIKYYKGHRIYNIPHTQNNRWQWNHDFRPTPGEFFFSDEELAFAESWRGRDFVVVEPNVPAYKSVAPNKQWDHSRFLDVTHRLKADGHEVVQFVHGGGYVLPGILPVATPDFRRALAVLAHSRLFIGAEGGMHHGAAAVGVKAVVIFGGFIPPQVTGYDFHINIATAPPACGFWVPCDHCYKALKTITVEQVYSAARSLIDDAAVPAGDRRVRCVSA